MRCLYCGEPLSLLRKLTGKAEFCSGAHRVAYQDEFNSLALQRLASQPTQSRRAKMSFTLPDPAVEFVATHQPPEPFAGFPFPDDPDDLDPPSQLPDFDQPVLGTAWLDAQPPAPLWGLLADAPLDANGETPPTYFFPILLEDYPRRYLMTNGVFHGAAVGALPFFGYVDLPEPLNDDADPGAKLVPDPFDAVIAWELPPGQILQVSPHELPVETRLVPFVAAALTGGYAESALAPPTCALVLPEAERRRLPVLVQRSSRRLEPGSLLAHFMPSNEPMAQAGEFESAAQGADVEYETWCSSRLLTAASWDAFTLPAKEFAAPGAQLDFDVRGRDYARSDEVTVPIPECECFDAERSLVAPHLDAGLNPSVGEAGWLEIEAAPSPLSGFGWLNSADPSRLAGQLVTGQLVTGQAAPGRWNVSGWNGSGNPSLAKSGLLEVSVELGHVCASNEPTLAAVQDYLPWRIRQKSAVSAADSCSEPALAQAGEVGASDVAQSGVSMELAVAASDVTWTEFSPMASAARRLPALGGAHPALLPFDGLSILAFELSAIAPEDEALPEVAVEPEIEPEIQAGPGCEPASWISRRLAAIRRPVLGPVSTLSKFRVKDFSWPEFAAGCESLFTPDQPFRFHELPFPTRGTTEKAAGDVLRCDLMQGLLLPYVDDRFGEILHPGLEAEVLGDWLEETANRAGNWPSAKPKTPTAGHPASAGAGCPPDEMKSAPPPARPAAPRVTEPPASWQQAARAMHEGEQQVQREPLPPSSTSSNDSPRATAPNDEGRPVTAVPVTGEPLSGFELTRMPPSEPPIRFQPGVSPQNRDGNRDGNHSPANDQPQFEWRREQPQQASSFSPPGHTGSNITVNTTINVDGSGDGVVVESAIRISLGNKKKKEDALEKFAEGEDLDEQRIRIAPREDLPAFTAAAPELRAMLEPMAALSDSVQWPKFSVTPMRRRIAFGPAKTTFFGGTGGQSTPRPAPPVPNPLPPKKGVGFLFKKLTNS